MVNNALNNYAVVQDQKKKLALLHTPPNRFTPVSPYGKAVANPSTRKKPQLVFTKEQLDMRRKAEILKHKGVSGGTKTNDLTQKERFALLSRGIGITSAFSFKDSTLPNRPTWSSASDVPGAPTFLYFDNRVPLYNYQTGIDRALFGNAQAQGAAEASQSGQPTVPPFSPITQNVLSFASQSDEVFVTPDVSNIIKGTMLSSQSRVATVGSFVINSTMSEPIFDFSMNIPVGIWMSGVYNEGLFSTDHCPGIENSWVYDPSYGPFNDPSYGLLDYSSCYVKPPYTFSPGDIMTIHPPSSATLSIAYSGNVVQVPASTYIHSFHASDLSFADVKFALAGDSGQFYGVQYIGNIVIENVRLNVQPNQVYDLSLILHYAYDAVFADRLDYFQTGVFLNLTADNQNISDGVQFLTNAPRYVPGSFKPFDPDGELAGVGPTIAAYEIRQGIDYFLLDQIEGNYDSYKVFRNDISNNSLIGSVEYKYLTDTSFTDANLAPNMTYEYFIMPIFNDMYGSKIYVDTITTQSVRISAQLDVSSVTTNSVRIVRIEGTFSSYTILRTVYSSDNYDISASSATFTNLTGATFLDSGLVPGVTYQYSIRGAIGSAAGAGQAPAIVLGTITTVFPRISSALYRYVSKTSVAIEINGNYSYVNIERTGYPSAVYLRAPPTSTNSDGQSMVFSDNSSNTSLTYLPNGYVPGKPYSYTIQPILIVNNQLFIGKDYHLPKVTVPLTELFVQIGSINMLSYTSGFAITNFKEFYYASIAQIHNGVIGPHIPQAINLSNYRDPSSIDTNRDIVFSANDTYAYSIIPYNTINTPGNELVTSPVSAYATVRIKDFTYDAYTVNFNIDMSNVYNFYYVKVDKILKTIFINSTETSNRNTTFYYGDTSYTDTLNTPGISFNNFIFNFTFTPYNKLDQVGASITTGDISPLATITPADYYYIGVSAEKIEVKLTANTFAYLMIYPAYIKINTVTGAVVDSSYGCSYNQIVTNHTFMDLYNGSNRTSLGQFQINKFLPTQAYYYRFIPYNPLNIPNADTMVTTTPVSPTAIVTYSNFSENNNVNLSKYSSVVLNFKSTNYYIFNNQYDINRAGMNNLSFYYVRVTDISNQVETDMDVSINATISAPNIAKTYTRLCTGLDPRVAYRFRLIPFNFLDQSGSPVLTSLFSPRSYLPDITISNTDVANTFVYDASSVFYKTTVTRFTRSNFTNATAYDEWTDDPYTFAKTLYQYTDVSSLFLASRAYYYHVDSYNALYDYSVNQYSVGGSWIQSLGDAFTTTMVSSSASVTIGSASMTDTDAAFLFDVCPSFCYVGVSYRKYTETPLPWTRVTNGNPVGENTYYYSANGPLFTIQWTPGLNNILGGNVLAIDISYTADTSYVYQFTPYNAVNAPNASAILESPYLSPPAVIRISPIDVSNHDISFAILNPTRFFFVDIQRIDGGVAGATVTVRNTDPTYQLTPLGTVNNTLFYSDTSYALVLSPYNALSTLNPSGVVTTTPVSPAAVVKLGAYSVAINAITFQYANYNQRQYTDINVGRIVNDELIDTTFLPNRGPTYTDPDSALPVTSSFAPFTADNTYQYVVTPFNVLGQPNPLGVVYTTVKSPLAAISFGTIDISYTYATFSYYYAANRFSYVNIARLVRGISVSVTRFGYAFDPYQRRNYVDPRTLYTSDTSYQYLVTPFNALGSANTASIVRTPAVSPYSQVSIGPIGCLVYDISFQYLDMTQFYYVSVAKGYGGTQWNYDPYLTQMTQDVSYSDPSFNRITRVPMFAADTSYAYRIQTYNAIGSPGMLFQTASVSPTATVYYGSPTGSVNITPTSVDFSYNTTYTVKDAYNTARYSYYNVEVKRYMNGAIRDTRVQNILPAGSQGVGYYVDPSSAFYADSSYVFSVTPYNGLRELNPLSTVWSNVVSPVASVTVSPLSISGDDVSFSFTNFGSKLYYDVSVTRFVDTQEIDQSHIAPNIRTYLDPSSTPILGGGYTKFTADRRYRYRVTPYNVLQQANLNATVMTNYDSPKAMVVYGSIDVSYTSIQVGFSYGLTRFYYVGVTKYMNRQVISSDVAQPVGALSYSDPSSVFTPDSSYYYFVNPYNAMNVANASRGFTTPAVSPVSYTVFRRFASSTIDDITFELDPVYSKSFFYISVARIARLGDVDIPSASVVTSYIDMPAYSGTYSDPYGLFYPYLSYTYTINSYNALLQPGKTTITPTTSPPADISFVSYDGVTNSALQINFNYDTSYSYTRVYEVSGGIVGKTVGTLYGAYNESARTSSIVDGSLWPRYVYSYRAVPYNAVDVSNGTCRTPNMSARAFLYDSSFTSVDTSSIVLAFNLAATHPQTYTLSFMDVSLVRITDGVRSGYVNVARNSYSYTDMAVTFDASSVYQYYLLPSNSIGVSGDSLTTERVSPLPSAVLQTYSSPTYSALWDTSAITVNFGYTPTQGITFRYAYIVQTASTGNVSTVQLGTGVRTYQFTQCAVDTSYIYTLLPYNALNAVGTPVYTQALCPKPIVTTDDFFYGVTTKTYFEFTFTRPTMFYYLLVKRVTSGTVGPEFRINRRASSFTYQDTGLFTPTDTYSYVVTPYNLLDQAGDTFNTDTVILSMTTVIFDTDYGYVYATGNVTVAFQFLDATTFYRVSVLRYVNQTVQGTAVQLPAAQTTYTDTNGPFYPDTTYNYQLSPYNQYGIVSITGRIMTPLTSPTAFVALGAFTNVTSNSIRFAYGATAATRSYSYVSVQRVIDSSPMGAGGVQPVGATLYADPSPGFFASARYQYRVVPYNAIGVANGAGMQTTAEVSPPADVVFDTSKVLTATSFTFTYRGNVTLYYYVGVSRSYNGVLVDPSPVKQPNRATTYQDPSSSGFFADCSYQYTLLPYNAVNTANPAASVTTVLSLPAAVVFDTFTSVTGSSVRFSYSGGSARNYYIRVARLVNSVAQGTPSTQAIRDTSYVDPTPTFYAYNRYQYILTPYNAVNEANAAAVFTTTAVSPPADVNYDAVTIYTNQVSFNYGYVTNGYAYIYVTRWFNGTKIDSVKQPTSGNAYVDPSAAFFADCSYQYWLNPYNAVDVSNVQSLVTTTVVSPDADVQFGTYTAVSSTQISFTYSGVVARYYYVTVVRQINQVGYDEPTPQTKKATAYTDPSSNTDARFYAYNTYNYALYPYNAIDDQVPDNAITTPLASPIPDVLFGAFTNVNNTIMRFTYLGDVTKYSYVYVTRLYQGAAVDTKKQGGVATTYVDPSSAFFADVSYQYRLVPYNAVDVSNVAGAVLSTVVSPPATVVFSVFNSVTNTSLAFTYANGPYRYSYVYIARLYQGAVVDSVKQGAGATTYVDPSGAFFADASYQYQLLPYNVLDSANAAGTAFSTVVSPPATVVFTDFSAVTNTSLAFTYANGPYRYSYIYVARLYQGAVVDTKKQGVGATTYVDPSNAFFADVSYQYRLIPYNAVDGSNVAGTALSTVVSPPATVVFSTFNSVTTTNLAFTYANGPYRYSYVYVTRLYQGVVVDSVKQGAGGTSYVDPSSAFFADASYQYQLLPYNVLDASNASGTTFSTVASPPATIDLAAVNASLYMNFGASSFVTGSFATGSLRRFFNLQVALITDGAVGSYTSVSNTESSYTLASSFAVDVSYQYSILSYNAVGELGSTYTTNALSAAPEVAFRSITFRKGTVTFTFESTRSFPSYYYVKIAKVIDGVAVSDFVSLPLGASSYTETYSDEECKYAMARQQQYSYLIQPFNKVDGAGLPITTDTFKPILGVLPTPDVVASITIMNTDGLVVYNPFDAFSQMPEDYVPPVLSVIDTDGMTMYYDFNV